MGQKAMYTNKPEFIDIVRRMASEAGGVSALSRLMEIPRQTIRIWINGTYQQITSDSLSALYDSAIDLLGNDAGQELLATFSIESLNDLQWSPPRQANSEFSAMISRMVVEAGGVLKLAKMIDRPRITVYKWLNGECEQITSDSLTVLYNVAVDLLGSDAGLDLLAAFGINVIESPEELPE